MAFLVYICYSGFSGISGTMAFLVYLVQWPFWYIWYSGFSGISGTMAFLVYLVPGTMAFLGTMKEATLCSGTVVAETAEAESATQPRHPAKSMRGSTSSGDFVEV